MVCDTSIGGVLHSMLPEFAAMKQSGSTEGSLSVGMVAGLQFSVDHPDAAPLMSQVVSLQAMMDSYEVLGQHFTSVVQQFKKQILHDRRTLMKYKDSLPSEPHAAQDAPLHELFLQSMNIVSADQYYTAYRLQKRNEETLA